MKLKIGDTVVTTKEITWDGGALPIGTTGNVANIIEFKDKNEPTYLVFNPSDTVEMLIIDTRSVNKQ